MRCVICAAEMPSAQRSTRRYCSPRCTYRARANKEGREALVPALDRPAEGLTYGGIHRRLERTFGPASRHACSDCGLPAQDWSYDNSDPNECVTPDGLAYSVDLSRYAPRCRHCHREVDNQARRTTARCGTEAGYYRHRQVTSTPPCQPCKDAHAAAARRRLAVLTEYEETPA